MVVADDLDKLSMRRVGKEIAPLTSDEGMLFSRAYVTDPLCCPSQVSHLRGQYVHNHGVVDHTPPDGGYVGSKEIEDDTLATRLPAAGYRTARFGKYTVNYDGEEIPPGWDEWQAWVGNPERQYRLEEPFPLNKNGAITEYDPERLKPLTPDTLLAGRASKFIRRSSENETPFYMHFMAHAPHRPHLYPKEYADDYAGAKYPRVPSVGEDLLDKPQWVRRFGTEAPDDEEYRDRLRATLTFRDAVESLTETLKETGELDNTYIIFTSDNGYRMGVHNLPTGKRTPYLEDSEVPLHVRGRA